MPLLKKIGNKFRTLIGLEDKKDLRVGAGYDPQLVRFFMSDEFQGLEQRYAAFKELLAQNNLVLNTMNDIQERLATGLITLSYFREEIESLLEQIRSFISALVKLSSGKYAWLSEVAQQIERQIQKELQGGRVDEQSLVYSLDRLSSIMAKEVGAKAANLGEVRNVLHAPTPEGFAISSQCYSKLIKANGIDRLIDILMEEIKGPDDLEGISNASTRIKQGILSCSLPDDVKEAIETMLERIDSKALLAVRSSAIGEDGTFTFAGQFKSVLGVPKAEVIRAYKQVCASLYEERAIRYRFAKNIPQDHHISMGVIVLEMIPSRVSGVIYTLDPMDPDSEQMVISATWGLGTSAVAGRVSPDTYVLDRKTHGKLINAEVGIKDTAAYLDQDQGGIYQASVDKSDIKSACLDNVALQRLFDLGIMIERHFGVPQDIEWAIDSSGWVYIIQARPLAMSRPVTCEFPEMDSEPVVTGEPVSPGVASGPVFVARDTALTSIPKGAILAIKTMDPEYAKLIHNAAGLIAETGSATTHLATVSREMGKPAIANARGALEVLGDGQLITLDADHGKVYKGYIESLVKSRLCEEEPHTSDDRHLPVMRKVMNHIVPLNLTDLQESVALEAGIKREDFKTVHDIIRFVHEASVREMFHLGKGGESDISHILKDPAVPLTFYIIDIESGLVPEAVFKRDIKPEDIQSRPFQALWAGMTHRSVSWTGPVQFDLGGFFSVMSRSFVEGNVSQTGGKAYIILSRDYINFHCRLAYHFTVIDSVCAQQPSSNYVTFRFEGGGAGADGRMRRIQLIREILEALYFRVEIKGDFLTGVFRGGSQQQTERRLDQLGRLMGFTRQLDMTLTDEKTRKRYVEAFLSGKYDRVASQVSEA